MGLLLPLDSYEACLVMDALNAFEPLPFDQQLADGLAARVRELRDLDQHPDTVLRYCGLGRYEGRRQG